MGDCLKSPLYRCITFFTASYLWSTSHPFVIGTFSEVGTALKEVETAGEEEKTLNTNMRSKNEE